MIRVKWDDVKCEFVVCPDEEKSREVKADLEKIRDYPITGFGCKVIKHPDACILCVANDDCDRLPVHVKCRCKPAPIVEGWDDDGRDL
jgi:hypothetical protein